MAYLAFSVVLFIAFYTIVFALEILRKKNYSGFFAIIILTSIMVVLPFYILFLKG